MIQTFQYNIIRNIVDAPRYAGNCDISRDLKINNVNAD